MLDERETAARFLTPDHEANATTAEIDHLAVARMNKSWSFSASESLM